VKIAKSADSRKKSKIVRQENPQHMCARFHVVSNPHIMGIGAKQSGIIHQKFQPPRKCSFTICVHKDCLLEGHCPAASEQQVSHFNPARTKHASGVSVMSIFGWNSFSELRVSSFLHAQITHGLFGSGLWSIEEAINTWQEAR
jgi:hypothetical protein